MAAVNTRDVTLQATSPRYSTATDYQSQIDAINTTINNIISDSVLTANEKQAIRREWDIVINDHQSNSSTSLYQLSVNYSAASSEWGSYTTAFEELATYLNNNVTYTIGSRPSIPSPAPLWISDAQLSNNHSIDPVEFRNKWMNMYLQRSFFENRAAFEAGKFADWSNVSGANKPANNATRNVVTYSSTAPSTPVDGDLWVDTSATPYLAKVRVSGAWQVSANYTTNTNQLTDGANLGGTATWTGVSSRPVLYRVTARGTSATGYPLESGVYNGETNANLRTRGNTYNVVSINRTTGVLSSLVTYDVSASGASAMASALNALTNSTVVIVYSYGNPAANRLNSGLDSAMYRCGASRAVFGSSEFKTGSAFILIGIPGCGEGQGYESYQGSTNNDTNAWVDVSFYILNGNFVVSGSSATPKTLLDYGYSGSMTATDGATWNSNITGQPADTRLYNNYCDTTGWVEGLMPSGWQSYGNSGTGGSSLPFRYYYPDGTYGLLWRAIAGTGGSAAQGGYISPNLYPNIDPTKTYRLAVWVKRHSTSVGGNAYISFGPSGPGMGQMRLLNGNDIGYDYNMYPYVSDLEYDTWYLAVAYIMPHNYTGGIPNTQGLYDSRSGTIVYKGTGLKFNSSATYLFVYGFCYGSAVAGQVVYFTPPMVHLCDGTEPSVQQLLSSAKKPVGNNTLINYGMSRWTNSATCDYIQDTTATDGMTLRVWQGWSTGNINGLGDTSYANTEFRLIVGKKYKAVARIKKVGAVDHLSYGIYNYGPGAPLVQGNLTSQITTSYQTLDLGTFTANWESSHIVQWWWGDSTLSNSINSANAYYIDWLQFILIDETINTPQILPGAITQSATTRNISSVLYNSTATTGIPNTSVSGPTISTSSSGRIFAAVTGRLSLAINTTGIRFSRHSLVLYLYNNSSGSTVDSSGNFGGDCILIRATGTNTAIGVSGSLIFDNVAAGSYTVKLQVYSNMTDDYGVSSTCLTYAAFYGEITVAELKV